MVKKFKAILSFLMAALTISLSSSFTASAVEVECHNYCGSLVGDGESEEDDDDIDYMKAYAEEHLGLNKDRFIWSNYGSGFGSLPFEGMEAVDENSVAYNRYLAKCSNIEVADNPLENYKECLSAGHCLGISLMSSLSHNGVIFPSDIQPGAESLIDIHCDTNVDIICSSYQLRQLNPDFKLYMEWNLTNFSQKETAEKLLECAGKAMSEKKYFPAILRAKKINHAVTIIGLLEGEWDFDGEQFDKCILTYDSNLLDSNDGNGIISLGCHSDMCIYVNSETGKAILPFQHRRGKDEGITFCVIEEEAFMNYNGIINPTSSYETDVSEINKIQLYRDNGTANIDVTKKDGSVYDGGAVCKPVSELNQKESYYLKGESFKITNTDKSKLFCTNFTDIYRSIKSEYDGSVDSIYKTSDEFNFNVYDNIETSYDISLVFNEGSYSFVPHYKYDLSGKTKSDLNINYTDRGIILSGSSGVSCVLETSDILRDGYGDLISSAENVTIDAVSAERSVMIGFDDNNDLSYYIGDKFDIKAEKGDVNCNGKIDIDDASRVLEAYALNAVGCTSYVGNILGDCDGNGSLNVTDATIILQKYALGAV